MRREVACVAPGWSRQTGAGAEKYFQHLGLRPVPALLPFLPQQKPAGFCAGNLISCTGFASEL